MSTKTDYSLTDLAKLKIHFIGVGGAGMSGIARIMLAKGFSISGSDKSDSAMLTSLKALGAEIFIGHASENLGDAQMVIISSAINEMLTAVRAKYLLPKLMSPMALFWHINPLARLLPTLNLIMLTISLTKMPFSLFLSNL